jgi:hypothetical protein
MTTKAEREAHRQSGLRAADFPSPPIPMLYPNAEWFEEYERWHAAYVRALMKSAQAA